MLVFQGRHHFLLEQCRQNHSCENLLPMKNVRIFAKYLTLGELVPKTNGKVTKFLKLPSDGKKNIATEKEWFAECLITALRKPPHFYIEKNGKEIEVG